MHGKVTSMFSQQRLSVFICCASILGLLAFSTSALGMSRYGIHQTPAYQAKPIPSQVPGVDQMIEGHTHAGFWINAQGDFAVLQMDKDPRYLQNLRLGCASAGSEGNIVWAANGAVPDNNWAFRILSADLNPHSADEICPVTINNVMSLNSVSAQRLLYVEFERDGVRHRGQLWSQKLRLTDGYFISGANLSDQQLVDEAPIIPEYRRAYSSLRFQEHTGDLDVVKYSSAPRQARLELRCAPAGTTGPVVAILDSPGMRLLTNADLIPTSGDAACGVSINNVASLLEAVLRGRLYVQAYHQDGVATTRGQFLSPYPDR